MRAFLAGRSIRMRETAGALELGLQVLANLQVFGEHRREVLIVRRTSAKPSCA
jgi:hypothetical protein